MEYLAVIKLAPSATPKKVTFHARNVREALDRLLQATHCTSTLDIFDYEVMEVVTGGYRPVASKGAPMSRVIEYETVGELVTKPDPPTTVSEKLYTPYALTVG